MNVLPSLCIASIVVFLAAGSFDIYWLAAIACPLIPITLIASLFAAFRGLADNPRTAASTIDASDQARRKQYNDHMRSITAGTPVPGARYVNYDGWLVETDAANNETVIMWVGNEATGKTKRA